MKQLAEIFSTSSAFAGLSCVHEQAKLSPGRRRKFPPSLAGKRETVSCWHSTLRAWPPEETAGSWAAADKRQLPSEDCGRVHHTGTSDDEGKVDEWFEYDLSGEEFV